MVLEARMNYFQIKTAKSLFVQNSLWRKLTDQMIAEMPPKSPKTTSNSTAKEDIKKPVADPLGEVGHDLDPS